jgi:hypothetical protein
MSPATRSSYSPAYGVFDRLDLGAAQAWFDRLLDGRLDRILRADARRDQAGRQQDGELRFTHV